MKRNLQLLSQLTVAGNIVFVLWLLSNGIDEGFKATPLQLVSYISLTILLAVNTYLILRKDKP